MKKRKSQKKTKRISKAKEKVNKIPLLKIYKEEYKKNIKLKQKEYLKSFIYMIIKNLLMNTLIITQNQQLLKSKKIIY